MPDKSTRILLVDNDGAIESEIHDALRRITVVPEIDFRQPKKRDIRFGCQMPEGREFDNYDLALIDLEIFPNLVADTMYTAEDLRGGTEILPYLRQEAPWLPTIAASRLFRKETEHFLAIAGSFGFDGHMPLQILNSKAFSLPLWESIIGHARKLRLRAVLGERVLSLARKPEIDPTDLAEEKLDKKYGLWREVAQTTFCFGTKLVIRPLQSGFSGADVFKVYVSQDGLEGEWVWKVSRSPWKLHQEIQAHLAMLRAGLDHARMVPLLWNAVLVENRVGSIAYKFAEETTVAAEMLESVKGARDLCKRIAPMFLRLYQSKQKARSSVRRLLSEWCSEKDNLLEVAKELAPAEIAQLLQGVVERSDIPILNADVSYQQCYVHGDLHSGNIMLGSTIGGSPDVLIDFAMSGVGPIAVDAAKFISDMLLRLPKIRSQELPTWDSQAKPMVDILRPLHKPFDFTDGDKKLFTFFLILYLAQALRYEDVSDETKDWIRKAFSRYRF